MFSGYQLYLDCQGDISERIGGVTSYWPEAQAVGGDTLFDVGSLTKVLATTTLAALGMQENKLQLTDSLGDWISELKGTRYAALELGELLSHAAGIVGWYPIFRDFSGKNVLEWFISHSDSVVISDPRKKTVYSDLGFLLLGAVLERCFGGDLAPVFEREVVRRLKLKSVSFGPIKPSENVAATEYCLERKRLLQGEVFDENSFALGGKTSHAGLFANAREIGAFCRGWLDAMKGKDSWLSTDIARLFTQRSGLVPQSTWGYGWDTKSKTFSSAGDLFSEKSFGHLGYTGCSMWVDPERDAIAIWLTNRVHPSRFDERIKRLRPRLHDEIATVWSLPGWKR